MFQREFKPTFFESVCRTTEMKLRNKQMLYVTCYQPLSYQRLSRLIVVTPFCANIRIFVIFCV